MSLKQLTQFIMVLVSIQLCVMIHYFTSTLGENRITYHNKVTFYPDVTSEKKIGVDAESKNKDRPRVMYNRSKQTKLQKKKKFKKLQLGKFPVNTRQQLVKQGLKRKEVRKTGSVKPVKKEKTIRKDKKIRFKKDIKKIKMNPKRVKKTGKLKNHKVKTNLMNSTKTIHALTREYMLADEVIIKWWKKEFPDMLDIMKVTKREKYQLILIVSSAPLRTDRREAIRQTWWKQCQNYKQVRCIFFTDGTVDDDGSRKELIIENRQHKDLFVQPLLSGVRFGERFLYHLRWALLAYDFEYFMRLDDDQFVCFDVLMYDLQHKVPKTNMIWSWIHCQENVVRPEESFIVISKDVVHKFLSQPKDTLLCHPFADQQIALWIQELQIKNIYYHDIRIHHDPPAASLPFLFKKENVCDEYIALHGSYPELMKIFWKNRGGSVQTSYSFKNYCNVKEVFDFQLLEYHWRYEPRLCSSKPTWDTRKLLGDSDMYYGREEQVNYGNLYEDSVVEIPQNILDRLNIDKTQENSYRESQEQDLLQRNQFGSVKVNEEEILNIDQLEIRRLNTVLEQCLESQLKLQTEYMDLKEKYEALRKQ
ncbi:uncharacterized protein LOC130642114 [Hydractinia symbiolongicarpus]|uniref:uncharacterized protein LOC130642114 n=1 Tax=Hydractinia symbiolongicarpus TaxID=13093 RepID=UPI00254F2ADB|nr:uncharacterized protein LOC130642114 [Hydractinia symbiolongicarpus]